MPADRFPLAVLVGGKVELTGILQRQLEVLDHLLAALGELVGRLEPIVHVDREALRRRQVSDVANRRATSTTSARNLAIVFAFAGTRTITRGLAMVSLAT